MFKCGRTTGKTRGDLNQIPATINMCHGRDDNETDMTGDMMLVLTTTDPRVWAGDVTRQIVFGTHGDSGSLVYDYQGNIAGTYIGGHFSDVASQRNPNIIKGQVPQGTENHHLGLALNKVSVDGLHFVVPAEAMLISIRDSVMAALPEAHNVEVEFRFGDHGKRCQEATWMQRVETLAMYGRSCAQRLLCLTARVWSSAQCVYALAPWQWPCHPWLVYPSEMIKGMREFRPWKFRSGGQPQMTVGTYTGALDG